MVTVESYSIAVLMCVITMLCWGSWANTQKLASKEWKFQLFYWDYSIGVLLLTLIFAFTLGSTGETGRNFMDDLDQAKGKMLALALIGGIVFNLSNILLVAAIDIAGMAVAFPVGVGIALVEGVVINYIREPKGNPLYLFVGVAAVVIAIIIDALAYRKLSAQEMKTPSKGIVLSVVSGVLMGLFYYLVAAAMSPIAKINEPVNAGLLTPYTALVFFALGVFISNFVFNTIVMAKPFTGEPVPLGDYFRKGNIKLHAVGILGGIIWSIGMSFSIIAKDAAGPAIAYGLGQGATMVAAFWGVFIWKEFKQAPAGTNKLLGLMFLFFIVGLALIVYANA